MKELVNNWFEKWESGDFMNLPITQDFVHVSPFGEIKGKDVYLDLVKANKDKFLGYKFDIHDQLIEADKACIRYTAIQGEFRLDVSEWHYQRNGLIYKIHAYYHIGEIREDRKLE